MKLLKDYSEQELVNLKKGQLIMTNTKTSNLSNKDTIYCNVNLINSN